MNEQDVIHADLVEIMDALGIDDYARPYSSHEVVQREVLPAIHALTLRLNDYQTLMALSRKYYKLAQVMGAQSRHAEQKEYRKISAVLSQLANNYVGILETT